MDGNMTAPPVAGQVIDGYRFKGGNPNDRNAWESISSTTRAPTDGAATDAYKADLDMIRSSREALSKYGSTNASLNAFNDLNHRQGTGLFYKDTSGLAGLNPRNWPLVAAQTVSSAFGQVPQHDPEIQRMNALTAPLQGAARVPGSGATSDFEQRLYRQGVPSVDKDGPVNQSIIAQMQGTLREEADRLDFMEQYLSGNGTLNGATAQWNAYVTANPYTRETNGLRTGAGILAPNENRKSWQEYFGRPATPAPATRTTAPAAQAQGGRGAVAPRPGAPAAPKSDTDLARAMFGGSAPRPAPGRGGR